MSEILRDIIIGVFVNAICALIVMAAKKLLSIISWNKNNSSLNNTIPINIFQTSNNPVNTGINYYPTSHSAQSFQEFSSFSVRLIANVVDYIILSIIVSPIYCFFPVKSPYASIHENYTLLNVFLIFTVYWLYYAFSESSRWQATIGKYLIGIKVVDVYGRRVSFSQATMRHFAKYLSTIILYIGYIMILFDNKKQGLHDKIAHTFVVSSNNNTYP